MPPPTNSIFFSLVQQTRGPGRAAAGEVATSKPALDAQQPHGRLLHGLVDAPDLSLRHRALHVAVGDAVAVAGPVCPGEQERKAGEWGSGVSPAEAVVKAEEDTGPPTGRYRGAPLLTAGVSLAEELVTGMLTAGSPWTECIRWEGSFLQIDFLGRP